MLYFQLENADDEIEAISWRGSDDNELSATIKGGPGKTVGVSAYI